jgi:exopolyphosphatase/guanosine-5'-triphosphate,3'-diphosphate pyrophosphatase
MPTGRADVIGGGAVVLDRLLRRLAPTLTLDRLVVSEHDILDGLAWSLVEL